MSKKIPRGPDDLICRWHKVPMSEVCHKCDHWTQLRGRNPNTGEDVDDWKCADSWIPILLLEIAQQGRSTAAAVENLTHETVKAHEQDRGVALSIAVRSAIPLGAAAPRLLASRPNTGE